MFVSTEDIIELTGYKVAAKQIKWLRQNGVRHMVNAAGKPLVMQKHVEELLCSPHAEAKKKRIDRAALDKVMGRVHVAS